MTGTRRPEAGPLALLGAALLGTGVASRVLVPESTGPVPAALPGLLLAAGAGCVLLDRAVVGGRSLPPLLLLLPLLLLPGFLPLEVTTVLRGLDLMTALGAGLALRILVLGAELRGPLFRALLALAAFQGLLALAQVGYQQGEAAAAIDSAGGASSLVAAFAASRRAFGTLLNANALAGALLLVLPLAAAALAGRRHVAVALPLVLVLTGFALAGSAGATLALLLASGLALAIRPALPPWVRRTSGSLGLLGLAGIAVLVLATVTGWEPPLFGSKVGTFGERLGYQALALEIPFDRWLPGLGFESTGDVLRRIAGPGDPWSRYLHNAWLQMALEAGPWILLSGIPFVAALVRTCRPGTPDAPVRVSTLPPRVFTGGIVAGSLLGPLLAPATTLFPLTSAPADQPLVNGLVAAASVGLVLRALQGVTPRGPGARAGLLVGLSAFALHGCVDFDVYIPGVAILFAATCALLPGTAADSGVRTRLGLGLLATVLLAIPLCSGMLVLRRDALLRELLATGPPRATPRELAAAAGGAVPDLAALRETLRLLDASRQDQEAEALLRGLAPALEERAAVRLTRAEHLLSSARRDPQRAGAAARAITALRVAGDADDPELLYLLSRALEAAGDRPAARAIAKEARAAARAWGLDRTSAPWLDDL